jgi:hypothetical protein
MALTIQTKTTGRSRRESRRALVVSVAVHIVVGAGLIRVLLMPSGLRDWLGLGDGAKPHAEHLRYVALPPATPQPPPQERATPTPPRATPPPGGQTIVAPPTSVPSALPVAPPVSKPPAPTEIDGVGPVAGTGGPGFGARPEYHGPQVWVPAAPPGEGAKPRSFSAQLDSSVHAIIDRHNDSLAMAGTPRQPGDWTKTIGGKKYGIDQQFIHLGPVEIPTAILAALPLNNFTGNPIAATNERLINSRSDDIKYQMNRALNDEEFNKAVKEERLRKEREHDQQQKQKDQPPADQQNNAPTVAKSGNQSGNQ